MLAESQLTVETAEEIPIQLLPIKLNSEFLKRHPYAVIPDPTDKDSRPEPAGYFASLDCAVSTIFNRLKGAATVLDISTNRRFDAEACRANWRARENGYYR